MGSRTTLFLLLLCAGLGAWLWFTDHQPKVEDVAETTLLEGRTLWDCKRVRWQFDGQAPVELSRLPDGRFQVTEPFVDLAAPGYVKVIFDSWNSAVVRRTPLRDDADGRQKAGLEPPQLTLLAEFPDGARFEVAVGAPGPLGTSRFVRRGNAIWEGGEALLETLRVGLDDLRDHAVFRHQEAQCDELQVVQLLPTGKRETLHLQRGGREWRLSAPRQARADQRAAVQFATAVLSLRVDTFPPGLVRFPGREPEIVVTARGAHGEETVRLWQENGAVFGELPGRGVAFTSDNRQYCQIFVNAAELLRARILLPQQASGEVAFLAEQLAEIIVDPGQGRGDRLRLSRAAATDPWRLVEPLEFAAGPTPCSELVQAINNLHAQEFVDGRSAADPEFGLGAGRLQVAVRSFDQREATTLWFGASVQKGELQLAYACRSDEPDAVVLVPAEPLLLVRRPWTAYPQLDVTQLVVPVERLELRPRQGDDRVYRRDGEHWLLDGAAGFRDEVGGLANDVLRDLRGQRAVDLRGDSFGQPDWRLRLCRGNGDPLAELRVWDRGKEAPLVVQAGNQPGVGVELSPFHSKALRELWQ